MKIKNVLRRAMVLAAFLWICAMLAWSAVAQEPSNPASADRAQAAATGERTRSITIGSGDLLEINIFGVPDLARSVRVSDGGIVYLPFIESVKVVGLTPEQAQDVIAKKYQEGNYLRNPQVSILIKEYASQGISVMGEVAKPGIYPLLGDVRLYDAISAAGGTTPRAGSKVTILHRAHPNEPQVLYLSNTADRASQSNVALPPGDTVIVSKAGVVYVMGDVTKPGGFVMENTDSLTAMQAVALAQGTTRTAALKRARLIRKGPTGFEEIPVPLDKIFAAKSPDINLQADDILFVPGSATKSARARTLETLLQTIPGAVIYGAVRY